MRVVQSSEGRQHVAICSLVLGGRREAWEALGFAVEPGPVPSIAVGSLRIVLEPSRPPGILRWELTGIPGGPQEGDLDGLPTSVVASLGPPPARAHPNGVRKVDHVVVASPDPERTAGALGDLGLSVVTSRLSEGYGRTARQLFFRMGEVILEVVGPTEPAGNAPAQFFGIAFETVDFDRARSILGSLATLPRTEPDQGRQILTVAEGAGVGVPIAMLSAPRQPATETKPPEPAPETAEERPSTARLAAVPPPPPPPPPPPKKKKKIYIKDNKLK
jgi:hypothetical protein